jgi:hypothetical protein
VVLVDCYQRFTSPVPSQPWFMGVTWFKGEVSNGYPFPSVTACNQVEGFEEKDKKDK